jgi:hypothetical protein
MNFCQPSVRPTRDMDTAIAVLAKSTCARSRQIGAGCSHRTWRTDGNFREVLLGPMRFAPQEDRRYRFDGEADLGRLQWRDWCTCEIPTLG